MRIHFSDKPRHAIELFHAPLVASGRAGCEVALLPIEQFPECVHCDLDYRVGRLGCDSEIALRIKVEVNARLLRQSRFDLSRDRVSKHFVRARLDGAEHLPNDI